MAKRHAQPASFLTIQGSAAWLRVWEAEQKNQSMIMHEATLFSSTASWCFCRKKLGSIVSYNSPAERAESRRPGSAAGFMDRTIRWPLAGADALNATSESGEDLAGYTGSFHPARSAFTPLRRRELSSPGKGIPRKMAL